MTNLNSEMLLIVRQAAAEEQQSARKLLRGTDFDQMLSSIQGDAMSRLNGQLGASPLVNIRECKAGCSMCCLTVSVDATCLEALAIADHLRHKTPPERREQIIGRLEKSARRRENMNDQQRKNLRMACAFLNRDGMCSIYECRPLACAGVFSLSKRACEDAYEAEALAVQQVPVDQPAKFLTMGTSAGLQHALVEAGLDGNLYELHSAAYRAVITPNAARRFFQGEDIFAGCLCTDAHSPPRAAGGSQSSDHRVDAPTESAQPHFGKLGKEERKKRSRLLAKKRS